MYKIENIYIYIYIYTYIYIYIRYYIIHVCVCMHIHIHHIITVYHSRSYHLCRRAQRIPGSPRESLGPGPSVDLHSAKGGAVETGCSGLHYIIGCFTI